LISISIFFVDITLDYFFDLFSDFSLFLLPCQTYYFISMWVLILPLFIPLLLCLKVGRGVPCLLSLSVCEPAYSNFSFHMLKEVHFFCILCRTFIIYFIIQAYLLQPPLVPLLKVTASVLRSTFQFKIFDRKGHVMLNKWIFLHLFNIWIYT